MSPNPDHKGPILPANGLIAALQGFPGDWKFRGETHSVFRQIGNAFPPIVALHLGCAIAAAMTGEHHDYLRAIGLQGTRYRLPPVQSVNADRQPREQTPPAGTLRPRLRDLGIKQLTATSSMLEREGGSEHLHESVYAPHVLDEESEAEHHVWYWEESVRSVLHDPK